MFGSGYKSLIQHKKVANYNIFYVSYYLSWLSGMPEAVPTGLKVVAYAWYINIILLSFRYKNKLDIEALASNKKMILCVEDNPVNLDLVIRFLDKYTDIEVMSSVNAEDGFDLISQRRPDLILLDINLPGMSGYEMLEKLRNHEETKTIPVVALTAEVMMQDIENGFASGFDDYLTKPLDLEIFTSTVLGILDMNKNGTV